MRRHHHKNSHKLHVAGKHRPRKLMGGHAENAHGLTTYHNKHFGMLKHVRAKVKL